MFDYMITYNSHMLLSIKYNTYKINIVTWSYNTYVTSDEYFLMSNIVHILTFTSA